MRSPRLLLAATALLATGALVGCSGDDDKDPGASAASPTSPSASDESKTFTRKCAVEVAVTGAAEASWKGAGTVTNDPGVTMYTSADGDNHLTVYAGNDKISTNANVTVDGATYTTGDPETGLDVAGNGTAADVDADVSGVGDTQAHLTATFTCGKSAEGKAKG